MTEDTRVQEIKRISGIVGREAEILKGLAVVSANRHLMIEGPVGVGKTVLASAIASHLNRPVYRVDGDERYTEQKLSGWFDPPVTLEKGYVEEAFIPGPLTEAMRNGGVLFVNEMNRMPEGVQNILLPAMDEGIIDIPKVGQVSARDGFVIIATQNPREFVATTALSEALSDRFELLMIDYQPVDEEMEILKRRLSSADDEVLRCSLWITRRTRNHPNIRRGASIRAAMSMVQLRTSLSLDLQDGIRRAAHLALPTRIELREESRATVDEVIDQIVDECFSEGNGLKRSSSGDNASSEGNRAETSKRGSDRRIIDIADVSKLLETHHEDALLGGDDIGWKIAQNYLKIRISLSDPAALELARRIAISATIRRVLRLLGPVSLPMRLVREGYAVGNRGEIDLESTLENIIAKRKAEPSDVVVTRREPKDLSVVLMLDASLSMSGDKLAIATAAIAVLAFRLKMVKYQLITFNDRPRTIKGFDETLNLDELVLSLLEFSAGGYTNIEAALREGSEALSKASTPNRVGVLVTDGNYTVGEDPSVVASSFKRLFVVMTASHDCQPQTCDNIARNGRGHMYSVSGFDEVPRVLYKVLRVVAQGSPS
ncbi:MAG: AAA family ATPase [Methanobacteriota archaeon]|nr:MAG: AAA family ATPase [Euryarchaeota archaeon]